MLRDKRPFTRKGRERDNNEQEAEATALHVLFLGIVLYIEYCEVHC